MPNVIYSRNARNYSNTTIETGLLVISNFVNPNVVNDFRVRVEVLNLSSGARMTVTYVIGHSGGSDGASTLVFDTLGKYDIGFVRGDLDSTSTIKATIVVTGTIRLSVEVWYVGKGEDYLEWL